MVAYKFNMIQLLFPQSTWTNAETPVKSEGHEYVLKNFQSKPRNALLLICTNHYTSVNTRVVWINKQANTQAKIVIPKMSC